jgi:hypothetical protein
MFSRKKKTEKPQDLQNNLFSVLAEENGETTPKKKKIKEKKKKKGSILKF